MQQTQVSAVLAADDLERGNDLLGHYTHTQSQSIHDSTITITIPGADMEQAYECACELMRRWSMMSCIAACLIANSDIQEQTQSHLRCSNVSSCRAKALGKGAHHDVNIVHRHTKVLREML